ncbi:MAG: helix-turn-helix domain-containing protein [Nanoarchaeota archaeon]
MGYTVIAPVGDDPKALFVGMKQFPTERVILLASDKNLKDAQALVKKLDEFTIKSEIKTLGNNTLEEMFKEFGNICSIYGNDNIIVNIATGDRTSTCAALSAAYANGLKAFDIMDNEPVLLPIMKLSYYHELSENKLRVLKALHEKKEISLRELSRAMGLSVSLLSYHINGNIKYKGLKEYRLISVRDEGKNVFISLSNMGNLLLKGCIKTGEQK